MKHLNDVIGIVKFARAKYNRLKTNDQYQSGFVANDFDKAIALLEGMGGQFVPQDSGVKRHADGTQEVWATGSNPHHPPTQTAAVPEGWKLRRQENGEYILDSPDDRHILIGRIKMAPDYHVFNIMADYFDALLGALAPVEKAVPEQPKCLDCGSALEVVDQGPNRYLNADQFDAIKPGDWFCRECPPDEGLVYHYFWDRQLMAPAAPGDGESHICEGCGTKGWTANCDQCIPY